MTRLSAFQRKAAISLIILLLYSGFALASELSPTVYHFESSVHIQNVGDKPVSFMKLQVPLLMKDSLYGTVVSEEFSLVPEEITQSDDGQRYAHFVVEELRPGEGFMLKISYVINMTPAVVEGGVYAVSPKIQWEDDEIRRAGAVLVENLKTDKDKAQSLLNFVREHMRYDRFSEFRNKDALTALQQGEGVCEDYAALFAALSKAAGIESRLVYGYRKNSRSIFERHTWVEIHLQDSWVPVDPVFYDVPGIDASAVYIAQWYADVPIRIRYSGGKIRAMSSETIAAAN